MITYHHSRVELEYLKFLHNIPALNKFSKASLQILGKKFKPMSPTRFQYLFKEGDPVKKIYIVKKGEFKITKQIVYHPSDKLESYDINENESKDMTNEKAVRMK